MCSRFPKKIYNHNHENFNIIILTWYIRMNRTSKLMPNCTNLNHKQKLLLDIKCHENYTMYIFQNFNDVFQKCKLKIL
jgi:hypothetical protein